MVRTAIVSVVLIATALLAACDAAPDATPTPTQTPSPTTAPVTPTPVPAATNTPSPVPNRVLRVDTLVCERFFPGVPNPDGPNEWLHVNGSVTNTGGVTFDTSILASMLAIDLLNPDGAPIRTVIPEFKEPEIAIDESVTFDAPSVNAEHPNAVSCRFRTEPVAEVAGISLVGETTAEVTILAAP